jgi:hypothetical protein
MNAPRNLCFLTAKRKLWHWGVALYLKRLPAGDCWIVSDCPEHYQFHVRGAIAEIAGNLDGVRIFFDRSEFWNVATRELLESGHNDELSRRLSGRLKNYDSAAYLAWARLLAKEERCLEAGMYFLFSGLYDATENDCVNLFKRTLVRAHLTEIIGRMPGPCLRRSARRMFPAKVYEDLASLPCPSWLQRRPPN